MKRGAKQKKTHKNKKQTNANVAKKKEAKLQLQLSYKFFKLPNQKLNFS